MPSAPRTFGISPATSLRFAAEATRQSAEMTSYAKQRTTDERRRRVNVRGTLAWPVMANRTVQ